jgi:hypothetical protein
MTNLYCGVVCADVGFVFIGPFAKTAAANYFGQYHLGVGAILLRPYRLNAGANYSANTAWVRVPKLVGQYRLGAGAKQSLPRASSAAPAEGLGAWGEPRAGCSAFCPHKSISANTAWVRVPNYVGHTAWVRAPTISANTAWARVPKLVGQYRLGAGATGMSPL